MKHLELACQLPRYFSILSDYDKYQYNCLRATLSIHFSKNQRNKRIENFSEILEMIKRFCIRNDGDDWRRCLVCGFCAIPNGIAISTKQLKLLIFKSKSSINGSLHKMGYTASGGRPELTNHLLSAIPLMRDDISELRQWTIRIAKSYSDSLTSENQSIISDSSTSECVESPKPPENDRKELQIPIPTNTQENTADSFEDLSSTLFNELFVDDCLVDNDLI